jgi:hypothetical protein
MKESQICAVNIQERRIYFAGDYQSDKFYFNRHEVKNRRQPVTQNTESSRNYTDYLPLDTVMQSTAAPGANVTTEEQNKYFRLI